MYCLLFRPGLANVRRASLLTLCLLSPTTSATADWQLQLAGQQVPSLHDVDFVDTQRGWAVGDGGVVYLTTNGGASWEGRILGTQDLRAVEFVSPLRGWAAGARIYATTDGGTTWAPQTSPTGALLEDLCLVSANIGYAVGDKGTILKTVDGAHWTQQDSGLAAGALLEAVDFISAGEGWVVGTGTVLHTANGGASWAARAAPSAGALRGVDFLSASTGWVVGSEQQIWRTDDGGATWTRQHHDPSGGDLHAIRMLTSRQGWVAGERGALLQTFNGGTTWHASSHPAGLRHLRALAFPTPGAGWVVGGAASQQGVVMGGALPRWVASTVRLEGRQQHQGTPVTTAPKLTPDNTRLTDAEGDFQLRAPGEPFTLEASRPGYLPAVKERVQTGPGELTRPGAVRLLAGDVDQDRRVDRVDLDATVQALREGTTLADLNGDGEVDIRDLVLTARNQGRRGPIPWPSADALGWWKAGAIEVNQAPTGFESAGRFAPDVVPLGDGSYRMYYTGSDGAKAYILSLRSTDGTQWTPEPGVRLAPVGNYLEVYSPNAVKLAGNRWRMYFSARQRDPVQADILSAVSDDGLAWTVEGGLRVAHGDPDDALVAQSPALFRNDDATPHRLADGRLRMIYTGHDGQSFHLLTASSPDGLIWTKARLKAASGALALHQGKPAAASLGAQPSAARNQAFGPLDIADPAADLQQDGTYRLWFSLAKPSETGANLADRLDLGLFSLWSLDGETWIDQLQPEMAPGLEGAGDGLHARAGSVQDMGEIAKLFYSALDHSGREEVFVANQTSAIDGPFFTLREVRTISVAQVDLVVDYALPSAPPPPPLSWRLSAAVIGTDQTRAAEFTSAFPTLTNRAGTATIRLDYVGNVPFESGAFEIELWTLAEGPLVEPPDLIFWQAFAHLRNASRKAVLLRRWQAAPANIFAKRLMADAIPAATGVRAATDAPLNPTPLAQAEPSAPSAPSPDYSEYFEEPHLWLPGSGGTLEVSQYSETPPGVTSRAPGSTRPVPGGPYLSVLVQHRYYNVWTTSGTLTAEVYGAQGQRLSQFYVVTVPVQPAAAPDALEAPPNENRIELAYTGTALRPDTHVKMVLNVGHEQVASTWLRRARQPGQSLGLLPEPYSKTWQPPAQFSFVGPTVRPLDTNAVRVDFGYTYSQLPGAPARPRVVAEVIGSTGQPILGGDFQSSSLAPYEGVWSLQSKPLSVMVHYAGAAELYGSATAGLRLKCVVNVGQEVILAQWDTSLDRGWGRSDEGFLRPLDSPNAVWEPVPECAWLEVSVLARQWNAARADAELRLEPISPSKVLLQTALDPRDFTSTTVRVPSVLRSVALTNDLPMPTLTEAAPSSSGEGEAAPGPLAQDLYRLTLTYQGTRAGVISDGVRVLMVNPTTGRPISSPLAIARGKRWNPAPTGELRSASIRRVADDQSDVTVTYDFQSTLGLSATIVPELYVDAAPSGGVQLPHALVAKFRSSLPQLVSGTDQQVTFSIFPVSPIPIATDRVRLRLLLGAASPGRYLDELWVEDPERRWDSFALIEVESVLRLAGESTNLTVTLNYRLTSAEPDHEYAVEVLPLSGLTGEPLPNFEGRWAIKDPMGATHAPQSASVSVRYLGADYYLSSPYLRIRILDDEYPFFVSKGQPLELYYRYQAEWNTAVPGLIAEPVLVPIAPNELMFHAGYEFYAAVQDLRPLVTLYRGDERLYPASSTVFSGAVFPTNIVVPAEGAHGTLLGRLSFNGDTDLETDRIEVSFMSADGSVPFLASSFVKPIRWSSYDPISGTNDFSLGMPRLERPATNVIHVFADYHCPDYYDTYATNGPILKAFLWTGLTPLFQPPTNVLELAEDTGDGAGLSDFRELLFESEAWTIGSPYDELQPTGGTVLDPAGFGPTLNAGFHRSRPSRSGAAPASPFITWVPATGHFDTRLEFKPTVGELDVDLLSLVFYDRNGSPLFGRTFPIQEHVMAPDLFRPPLVDTENIVSRGEMSLTVLFALNSPIANPVLWLEPFRRANSQYPYYPLELTSLLYLSKTEGETNPPSSVDALGVPYVPVRHGWGAALFRFRLADYTLRETLDEELRFGIGSLTGQVRLPAVAQTNQPLALTWNQSGAIDDDQTSPEGIRFEPGEYPNQIVATSIPFQQLDDWAEAGHSYLWPLNLPNYLLARPLSNGVAIAGLRVPPARLDQATGRASLTIEYDFSDTPAETVTADQIQFFIVETPDLSALELVGQRLLTLEEPLTWHRPPIQPEITETVQEGVQLRTTVRCTLFTPSDPSMPTVHQSLGPDEFVGVQIKALLFGQELPEPIQSELHELRIGPDTAASTFTESLHYEGSGQFQVSNQLGAYVGVYARNHGGTGPYLKRSLAYTLVDQVTLWKNVNSFIVATLDQVTIYDDGDGDLRGRGEDLMNIIAMTTDAASVEEALAVFKPDYEGDAIKKELVWPVEVNKDSRWRETDASADKPATLNLQLPVFSLKEQNMRPVLGVAVMLVDDDTIPAFVTWLINILFEIAAQIAMAYGQDYLVVVLNFLQDFVNKMVAKDAAPDQIETAGLLITQKDGWGVKVTSASDMASRVGYLKDGKMVPTFRVQRLVVPPDPKPVTVVLKSIYVRNDGDGGLDGKGEIYGKIRVNDGKHTIAEVRFPTSGTKDVEDPYTWNLELTAFATREVGPVLYIEVVVWDEDEPSIGNDHDNLGICTWTEYPYSDGWTPKTLTQTSAIEGDVQVTVEIKDTYQP